MDPSVNSGQALSVRRAAILEAVREERWAIYPPALEEALARLQAGDLPEARSDPESAEAALPRGLASRAGDVAVLPVRGVILPRVSLIFELFGMATSTERLAAAVRQASNDPSVKAIVLDIDSPGGSTAGNPELAEVLFEARERKPMVASANMMAASAAYWIASQATEVVAAPSAIVGSIGVYMIHQDRSKMAEAAGVKVTYISAGKYKVDGNPFEPLSDTAREEMQAIVDDLYGQFVGHVARGRGVTPAEVRSQYGDGKVFAAAEAKRLGLIDRVESFEQTLARLGAGRSPEAAETRGRQRAEVAAADELELRQRRLARRKVV